MNLAAKMDRRVLTVHTAYLQDVVPDSKKLLIKDYINMQPTHQSNDDNMLRSELELLMKERDTLLIIAGAAAGLIAELNTSDLPIRTVEAADLLATTINRLSEETLQDALHSVQAKIEQ